MARPRTTSFPIVINSLDGELLFRADLAPLMSPEPTPLTASIADPAAEVIPFLSPFITSRPSCPQLTFLMALTISETMLETNPMIFLATLPMISPIFSHAVPFPDRVSLIEAKESAMSLNNGFRKSIATLTAGPILSASHEVNSASAVMMLVIATTLNVRTLLKTWPQLIAVSTPACPKASLMAVLI